MIIYICECGESLTIADNSEDSRKVKRVWKLKHGKKRDDGSLNIGHSWARRVIRKRG